MQTDTIIESFGQFHPNKECFVKNERIIFQECRLRKRLSITIALIREE